MASTQRAQDVVTGLPVDPADAPLIREQWDANWGYCGETSLIAAGMTFGQYASQFTVRALASPGLPQVQEASQLLLGVNDKAAARVMHLTVSQYNESGGLTDRARAARFVSWMRDRIAEGARVVLGVYIKGSRDAEYDHIVPAVDLVASGVENGGRSWLNDRLFFSDNYGRLRAGTFRSLFRDRRGANVSSAPPYSIPSRVNHYAVAIAGVADRERVTIPVMLQASRRGEPELADGVLLPPTPESLAIRATVLIPDQNQSYNLYRYDDFSKVPEASFNAAAANAIQSWVIPDHSGATVAFDVDVLTSDTAVFRAVPSTAL